MTSVLISLRDLDLLPFLPMHLVGAIAAQLKTGASAPVLRFEFERGAAEVAPAASNKKRKK